MSSNESVSSELETKAHNNADTPAGGEQSDATAQNGDETQGDDTRESASHEPGHDASAREAGDHASSDAGTSQNQGAESAADKEEAAQSSSRPRPRLNPTVDEGQAKAVPSLPPNSAKSATTTPQPPAQPTQPEPSAAAPETSNSPATQQDERASAPADAEAPSEVKSETESSAGVAASSDETATAEEKPSAKPPQPPSRKDPVELPPANSTLDAELEAEIEAAMSSGELDPLGAAASAQTETGADQPAEEELERGTRLRGKIQSLHGDDVFLDVGYRSPAVVSRRQFSANRRPEVGQLIEVIIDRVDEDGGLIHVNLPKGVRTTVGNWDTLNVGQIVDCIVTGSNKGGLEVTVGGLRGFLPASQVDISYVSDLEPYLGEKFRVQISEVNPRKRNLVVSRRAHLLEERKEAEKELWKSLEVGQVFTGTVRTIKDYGAFVDLGGADGFLHIGEMSWTRLKHPSQVVREGLQVEVKVIGLDPEKRKISLGMRQLTTNPWLDALEKYPSGSPVSGKVTRTSNFGAFVELEPGIEGLIHISELDHKRVNRVTDVLRVDQQVEAQVLEVDPDRKRVALSLKALKEKPAEKTDEDLSPTAGKDYERQHKGPLKGGMGGGTGSNLFGNPNDYT